MRSYSSAMPSVGIRLAGMVLLGTLAACGGGGGGGDGCPADEVSVACPRTLAGTLDTAITVSAAGDPYGAAVSVNGIAYVTLHGTKDALGKYDFATGIYVDTAITVGDEPLSVAFSPNGETAYVASQAASRVDVVTVASGAVSAANNPGNNPNQTVVLPNGLRFYTSGNAGRIWVFNAVNRALIDSFPVGSDPNGMALNPTGGRMFVTHLSNGIIGVINMGTQVFDTLALVGNFPVQGIAVSKTGTRVFVVSESKDSLYMLDASSGANLGQAYAGNEPFGLALTPDGAEVWVTTLNGELRRFNQSNLASAGTLNLGGTLRRIAIDPAGRGAVIADEDGRVIIVQ